MSTKFNVGDWCFQEFELKQIKRMEGGRICEVSDGMFCTSSYDLSETCFPLDLTIKIISDSVSYYSKKFHDIRNVNLNYPDIHRKLVSVWVAACIKKDEEEAAKSCYEQLANLYRSVRDRIDAYNQETVDDVRIFGRQ